MTDQFPSEERRIIRVLQEDVERLKTIARTVAPSPVTRASAPFDLPDASSPASPPAGVRLYATSGKLAVKNASGDTMTIPISNVSNPPNFGSPSSQSGDYASASAYTQLRQDAANVHDTLRDLMNALRNAGFMV
ncbi:hypothetical protein AB0C10_21340 [Microbispora amethystogenes]|uniref:hypothetical protein n=1 Tax=Microbispora amethystogenes TaxID=1427754 RepID=UPI0033F8FEED